MTRRTRWVALLLAGAATLATAQAGTLERVRDAGVLRCGASARAGFADAAEDGHVSGLAVDLCRALAIGVLGPAGRVEVRLSDTVQGLGASVVGLDDVSFLTAPDVQAQTLASQIIPGPVVFIVELAALAQPGISTLAGRTVCFLSGTPAHQAMEAWAARTGTPVVRSGYQEEGEMHDAFDARRCDAMVGEATDLAAFRAGSPRRGRASILPPFGVMPVFAATSAADGAWASLTGWALAAIVQSDRNPSPWRGDLPGTDGPGLRPGWQAEIMAALGGYDDMSRRALGGTGPGLTAHASASWPAGLLLPFGPR